MIKVGNYPLLVRRKISLNIMEDTVKPIDESQQQQETMFVEKTTFRKTVICPCCNHRFDQKQIPEKIPKNKKSKGNIK